MTVEEFFDHVITVRMREDRSSLDIIDQTLLPGTIKRINLNTKEEIWGGNQEAESARRSCNRRCGCLWNCPAGIGHSRGPV